MPTYKDRPQVELEQFNQDTPEGAVSSRRELARKLNQVIRDAGVNWVGELTLETAAVTTTVVDDLITDSSIVLLMPKTQNAAMHLGNCHIGDTDLAPGAPYLSQEVGRFVINHPNPLPADCEFRYAIIG